MTSAEATTGAQSKIWEVEACETDEARTRPEMPGKPRCKAINREQMTWAAVDVEQLVPPEHVVRAIWELVGRLDVSQWQQDSKAVEGVAGCSPYDPRLLISLWVLAYSEGISSAREVERRCQYHPAYQWLTGLQVVGHHTLSDFRVKDKKVLDELFAQVLAVLRAEEMITLERVMQDGTKVKAAASPNSFHRQEKLQQHLEEARTQVKQMSDEEAGEGSERNERQQQGLARAAREKLERMEAALEELKRVQAAAVAQGKVTSECRVSETEPEARKMKQPMDGGFAPSYNLQIVSDSAHGIIVGVEVVQACNDQRQLESGLEKVQQQTGTLPKQAVVDEGYLSRATVLEMERRGVDLYSAGNLSGAADGSQAEENCRRRGVAAEFYPQRFIYDPDRDLYVCPAGQELPHRGVKHDREGVNRHQYRARAAACRACVHQAQCCPAKGKAFKVRLITRTENVPSVAAFVEKMKTAEAKAIYRERKRVAEFPNLWLKEKLKLRRFCVRGLVKAGCEALWASLTYNIQQWARQRWKPERSGAAA